VIAAPADYSFMLAPSGALRIGSPIGIWDLDLVTR